MSDTLTVLAWFLFFAGVGCLLFGFLGLIEWVAEQLGLIEYEEGGEQDDENMGRDRDCIDVTVVWTDDRRMDPDQPGRRQ